MSTRIRITALLAAALLAPLTTEAAGTRTHVSNAGSDANTAFSCDSAHPCRTFAAALTQTTPGGEILAIDSSGYGKVVIDRSVSIVAAPGVFAGIGVGAGGNATGVEIATAGVEVVLRGLSLIGQGGNHGVYMSNGAKLSIENCLIANFAVNGIRVGTPATVRIVDSLLRDNHIGIQLNGGATAIATGNGIHGGYIGVYVYTNSATTVTTATVRDAAISGAVYGVAVQASTFPTAASHLTLSNSVVTLNTVYGLYQSADSGAAATLESPGNNTVRRNGSSPADNTHGTITPVPPI